MPGLTELGRQWNDAVGSADQPWNTLGLSPGITHEAEQPNPVPGIVEGVRQYLQSGDYTPIHELGTRPTDYLRELARNPDIMARNIDQASQFNFGGVTKPITAYHASPHDFEQFDLSKIGTGQGAQTYGHGFYAAENPAVSGRGGQYDQEFTAKTGKPAHIYEVAIKADPEHFLDWDKPLSEQSKEVKKALEPIMNQLGMSTEPSSGAAPNLGETLIRTLTNKSYTHPDLTRRPDQIASDALREAGIPGIKYLDQGSRDLGVDVTRLEGALENARKHQPKDVPAIETDLAAARARRDAGSRNYVVFDDKTIDILKKYGLLGLFGGGAASQGLPGAGQQ